MSTKYTKKASFKSVALLQWYEIKGPAGGEGIAVKDFSRFVRPVIRFFIYRSYSGSSSIQQ